MRIFLTGFMGAGKSTAGRRLAKALDLEFLDLDFEIERVTGMKIAEIFIEKGEEDFRKTESETLRTLTTDQSHALISTGGGTPCFLENMKFMNSAGITVYLELPVGALVNRLMNSKNARPLIEGMNEKELNSYVADTLAQRVPYYRKAQIIVNGMNVDEKGLTEKIRSQYDIS